MSSFIEEIRLTKRVDYRDWDIITKGPLFLEFLRNRVMVYYDMKSQDEDGNPAFWAVLEWLEDNMNDLWYVDNDSIYFYSAEDAMAFKLMWS